MTGRIYYSSLQFNQGLSIFGKDFSNISINGVKILFDNSYSMLPSVYGILITLLLYLYMKSIKFLIKKQLDGLILMFLMFSIYLFTESYIVSALINLTLLVISKIYFDETEMLVKDFS